MKNIVVFDLDGVLADFYEGYDRACVALGEPVPPRSPWRWDDRWNKKVWEHIRHSPMFWRTLDPLVPAQTFQRISKLGYNNDVYFATSRPGVNVKGQTQGWLSEQGIAFPTVVITGAKGEFAAAVKATHLLDDKAGNCVFTAYHYRDCKTCILDAPYNQYDPEVLGSKVIRVGTVEEFLDIVEHKNGK